MSNIEEHLTTFQLEFESLVTEFVSKPSILAMIPDKKYNELKSNLENLNDEIYEFSSSAQFTQCLGSIIPLDKEHAVNNSPVKQDGNIGIEHQPRMQQMIVGGGGFGNQVERNNPLNLIQNLNLVNQIEVLDQGIPNIQNIPAQIQNAQVNPIPNQHITCHFFPILTGSISMPITEEDIQILLEQNPSILHLPLNANLRHIKNSILRPILNCLPLGSVPLGLKRGRMQVHFLGVNTDQWHEWLDRFVDVLRERNNQEEFMVQENPAVEIQPAIGEDVQHFGNFARLNPEVNQPIEEGLNVGNQQPFRIESMLINGTTDLWTMTRGLVRNGSVFIVECKQAEPAFLLQGMIN